MSDDPALYRMVYLSRAVRALTRGELEDLMAGARLRNAQNGVTGLLVYDSGNFAQVLEGPREIVEKLFWTIERDPRHHHAVIINQWPIERRDFAGWAMGYQNITERKDPNMEKLRELIRTQRVQDSGVAYQFIRTFAESLKDEDAMRSPAR